MFPCITMRGGMKGWRVKPKKADPSQGGKKAISWPACEHMTTQQRKREGKKISFCFPGSQTQAASGGGTSG